MARTGLVDLLLGLRGMTDAGTADWTNGTATFWDDDQLQAVLDRHRTDVYREHLNPIADRAAGSIQYMVYLSRFRNLEKTSGGSAIFIVEDSIGNDQGTALWSADYARGIVTFGADQGGTAYYLTGRRFDLEASAADVWRMKAANAAKLFNFSTDSHSLSREQIMQHCLKMADYYDGKSGLEVITMNRGDLA